MKGGTHELAQGVRIGHTRNAGQDGQGQREFCWALRKNADGKKALFPAALRKQVVLWSAFADAATQILHHGFKAPFFFFNPVHNSVVQPFGVRTQTVSVDIQKDMTDRKSYPFVAVNKRMVDEQAFHERGGFFDDVRIIAALRPKQRSFNCSEVAHTIGAAIYLDGFGVDGQNFMQSRLIPHFASSRYRLSYCSKLLLKASITCLRGVLPVFRSM